MLVLSGDVGGTKTRLQITKFKDYEHSEIYASAKYFNHQFGSFTEIIESFLKQHQFTAAQIERTCFAVAGPIIHGCVKFTNLPWFVSETLLRDELGFKHICLINDFEAIGYGLDTLQAGDTHILQQGEAIPNKIRAIIGAGTGLGVAISVYNNDRFQVIPTEGGHVDFAPTDAAQDALWQYLSKKLHRVSIERLVSGPGILNIYNFVRDNPLFNEKENPALRLKLFQGDDAAAIIAEYAMVHNDHMAIRALDLFIRIYGACAGNLALTTLPYSGLYIVGGIAPKLLPQLLDGRFLQAFSDKGRMSNLLTNIPIYIVLDTMIGLQGAANFAYLHQC